MARQTYRIVLVIGDDHKEIIKKYSADTTVDKHLFMKFDDAALNKENRLKMIEGIMTSSSIPLSEAQKDIYKNLYLDLKEMDDFEYYRTVTDGCFYDEETGDAYTTKNTNAYYQYERCPQSRLIKLGEESTFANPFILLNGEKSYSAKVGDIDWSKMHMTNAAPYEAAWEMVVENRKPKNSTEKRIYDVMKNKIDYFTVNFKDKDEYVKHSCSFWCYGVATKDWYKEIDYTISDKDWVANFYDRFIKTLDENELLTIYEVKAID